MRWARRNPVVAVVVATALAVAMGAVLGNALVDDPGRRAPEAGPPVAVALPAGAHDDADPDGLDPIDAAVDEPRAGASVAPVGDLAALAGDEVLARVFDPETGVGSDAEGPIVMPSGAPLDDPAGADPGDDTDDEGDDRAAEDPEPVEPVEAEGASGEAGFSGFLGIDAVSSWFFRFVDGCAEEPGAAGCPEGVGGSILVPIGEDLDDLPPITVAHQTYAHLDPSAFRCPQGRRDDGSLDVLLSTNVPAASLRIEQVAAGTTLERWDLVTTEEEQDRFERFWLGGGVPSTAPANGVVHCFTVEDWERGDSHLRVRAEDAAGHVAEEVVRLEVLNVRRSEGSSPGRPPVVVTPEGERLVVGVPIDADVEQAWVVTLHRTGPNATAHTCTTVEPEVLARRHRGGVDVVPIRAAALPAGDHSAEYDQLAQWAVYPGEGAVFDLCTWVTTSPTRSFDQPGVQLRELRRIDAPRHYRTTIDVSSMHLDEAIAAESIRVEAPHWVGAPAVSLPESALAAGRHRPAGEPTLFHSGAAPHPDRTFLKVTGPSGRAAWVAVPTPLACAEACLGTRLYDLPIPGASYEEGLCGGWSCGDRGEDVTDGVITVAVTTAAGPAGPPSGAAPSEWTVGGGGPFAAGPDAAPVPYPQLDWHASRSEVLTEAGAPVVQVTLAFDRPVDAELMVDIVPGHPCAQPAQRSTARRQVQVFVVRDLCVGHLYSFGFLATDVEGGVTDHRPRVDGEPTGRPGILYAEVPGRRVTSLAYDVAFQPEGRLVLDAIDVQLGGWSIPLAARGAPVACIGESALPFERSGTVRNGGGGGPVVLTDPMLATLRVRAHRCDGETLTLDLRATPRLVDLLAGTVTFRGEGPAGTAEITITVTP